MMLLESCLATQSWVSREYRRGLSMHPMLRISVADVVLPTLTKLGAAHQEVQDPVAEGGVFVPGSLV
jgi:hypothetical protein